MSLDELKDKIVLQNNKSECRILIYNTGVEMRFQATSYFVRNQ